MLKVLLVRIIHCIRGNNRFTDLRSWMRDLHIWFFLSPLFQTRGAAGPERSVRSHVDETAENPQHTNRITDQQSDSRNLSTNLFLIQHLPHTLLLSSYLLCYLVSAAVAEVKSGETETLQLVIKHHCCLHSRTEAERQEEQFAAITRPSGAVATSPVPLRAVFPWYLITFNKYNVCSVQLFLDLVVSP